MPELVACCVVIGVLIAVSLFIAHPTDYGPARRDAARWAAISQQMMMISNYVAHEGILPTTIPEKETPIGSGEDMADLCFDLVPTYATELPYDPTQGAAITDTNCAQEDAQYYTGFTVSGTYNNKVTISAPAAETDQKISLTKQF
jgi:hypothetical protein